MREAMRKVQAFHELIRAAQVVRLTECPKLPNAGLLVAAGSVASLARGLKTTAINRYHQGDPRELRAHLVLEEAAEFVEALAHCDEQLALDALSDLTYVVVGSALALDLPLPEGFDEVHESNMTKTPPAGDVRAQHKGANYRPPNLAEVLRRHREE